MHLLRPLFVCGLLLLSVPAWAQRSYPMIVGVRPAAVQVGTTAEVEVISTHSMAGAYQALVSGQGVAAEPILPEAKPGEDPAQAPPLTTLKLKVTVAADAQPGVRDFRLGTAQGASTLGQLVIVRDPVVVEAANNDTPAGAQPVTLPATLCGAIEKAEDIDLFKFEAKAGMALTFHVRSCRLQDKLHDFQLRSDPILTLRNAQGTVLELVDNYFFADPLMHYRFTADGEYQLEIRDLRYLGNANWHYSIEVNDRPFVTNVHPLALAPGQETRLELVGYNLPADPIAPLTMPADAAEGRNWASLAVSGGQPATPAPVVVSRLPLAMEAAQENDTVEKAQPLAIASGVNGRIDQPADIDVYSFEAKQGERFTIEVMARRHQSSLDPILRILNDKGGALIENDDLQVGRHGYADASIENWTAPADGKYFIELRDLHLRGGPTFVYFLQLTRAEPFFDLELDTDKSLLTPGTGAALFARCYRKNGFTGEIQLSVEGLPPGVTAACGRILETGTDGNIILQSAAGVSAKTLGNIRVIGTAQLTNADGSQTTLTRIARPLQEVYNPGGGRTHYPVDVHTVSVGDVMDIQSVTLSTNRITLKPGESQKVDITITRRQGFDKNVTLDCVMQHLGARYGDCLPKGVTVDDKASKTLLTANETVGSLVLKAADDALAVKDHQLPVMANVSINFVMKYAYTAEPLLITVERPAEPAK